MALDTVEEAEQFFRDLCTLRELEEVSQRWAIARLLADGLHYREIAEATGANVFFVMDGEIHTPKADCFLDGITRRTVIDLARARQLKVIERAIMPEELAKASECFLTGTAAEITPVKKIDHLPVGEGVRGPVTRRMQDRFFGLFDGSTPDRWGWLEPV